MLVPSTHELKEELRAGAGDGEIADLVDDHEAREDECAQAPREMSRLLRVFQSRDQIRQRRIVDAASTLGSGDGETDREVGFADAWRPEEHDILITV